MEKKKQNALLLIMGILILTMILFVGLTFDDDPIAKGIGLVVLAFIALYGFWLYKKPHGNMLKYGMLLFAFSSFYTTLRAMNFCVIPFYQNFIFVLTLAAICYGAGRLDRIGQNKILFSSISIIILVLNIIWGLDATQDIISFVSFLACPITWITLMIAYFVRYKEHKEAGISDK